MAEVLGIPNRYLPTFLIPLSAQGKRILTILDKMNFVWVAYPRFRHI
jgi:hypothetical protein